MNNLDNFLFNLLPPPRDAALIGRLRSAHLLPIPMTRASKYRSFIHYGSTHYQPKLKSLSYDSYSFGNQNCVLYVVVTAVAVTAFFSHRIH